MKILFIGDISGRPGRETIKEVLPEVIKKEKTDLVIANCENAAGGRGVTMDVINELSGHGIDFFTAGEHVWDIKDFLKDMDLPNIPLVRPYNYEQTDRLPGKGFEVLDLGSRGKLAVITLLGQEFMRDRVRSPFWAADEILKKLEEEKMITDDVPIIVDVHAEATSEKVSLAYYLSDRVSAVIGTHTHVATADARLIGSTAFVTDAGMVGPWDASLWADFKNIIHNFKYPYKKAFKMVTSGRRVFNSVLFEIKGRKALNIKRIDRIIE